VISIQRISPNHQLYAQESALRETVLLRPLGLTMDRFRQLFPGVEGRLEHFVASVEHRDGPKVIGCATLLANDPHPRTGRLMQMAVDPQRQNEGVGRRLVVAIESRAFGELGLEELFCHAQVKATGFYERLGWEAASEVFDEAGIPHRRMTLRHPAADPDL
jgi:N-acetylglutamate synthase-like GNAT family acetyltransferase